GGSVGCCNETMGSRMWKGVLAVLAGVTLTLHAQQTAPARAGEASGLEVLQLRPNFYVIIGAGGNIAIQVGEDGVIVVDAGSLAKADDVVTAIKSLWDK